MENALDIAREQELQQEELIVAGYVKLKMLRHMAEGLEDEADGICGRAESLAEEEFLVVREIDEHQTEINRLLLKLQGIRSERYGLLERIDRLRSEASVLKEKVWTGEDELALNSLESPEPDDCGASNKTAVRGRECDAVRPPHIIPSLSDREAKSQEATPALPGGAAPVFFKMHGPTGAPARTSALANCPPDNVFLGSRKQAAAPDLFLCHFREGLRSAVLRSGAGLNADPRRGTVPASSS